jgi:hypothetical protein
MDKIQIGNNFFIPMPVVLVGTQVSGKANFIPLGWCSRANASPARPRRSRPHPARGRGRRGSRVPARATPLKEEQCF